MVDWHFGRGFDAVFGRLGKVREIVKFLRSMESIIHVLFNCLLFTLFI